MGAYDPNIIYGTTKTIVAFNRPFFSLQDLASKMETYCDEVVRNEEPELSMLMLIAIQETLSVLGIFTQDQIDNIVKINLLLPAQQQSEAI